MSDFGDDEDDLFNDEGAMAQLDASINSQSPAGRPPTNTVRKPCTKFGFKDNFWDN